MEWFDGINPITQSCTNFEDSILVKRKNVRYTPSERSHADIKSPRTRKQRSKSKENLTISLVTRDPERSVCLINQEEVDQFINLICKYILYTFIEF